LAEGALIATARRLLPKYPAAEILRSARENGALGPTVIARVLTPGYYEIAGPAGAGADAARRIAEELANCGATFILLDGAADRLAALRGGVEAIVVATGAASGPTQAHVVEDIRGLTAKLSIRLADQEKPALRIAGALSISEAEALASAGEKRQILVRDATRIAFAGRLFLTLANRLDFRCERALHPVAATVASMGSGRLFEPSDFLQAVAHAVRLPAYDVYAQAAA
jgi:hypothetical protein